MRKRVAIMVSGAAIFFLATPVVGAAAVTYGPYFDKNTCEEYAAVHEDRGRTVHGCYYARGGYYFDILS